jgi:hypothetical protein
MRRTLCCLLLGLLGAVTTGSGIASAHLCTVAAQIAVGKPQTISVGVTVEGQPIPDFEVQVPPQLRIDRVDPAIGFRVTRHGQTLRYRGIPIDPYTCRYVSLGVTALTKGAYGIPVTQRTADGTVVVRGKFAPADALNPLFGQVVYAGVKPPPAPSQGDGGGTSIVTYVGIALVAVALIALIGLGVRSWRNRGADDDDADDEGSDDDERDAELQSRVAQFKKQTRDRAEPR